jgi:hypothetical protein
MYYNGCCVAPRGGNREQRLQKAWKAQRGRHEACLLIHESVNKGVMSKEVEIFFRDPEA